MRKIHWYDYITVNIYWLGLTTVSQSFSIIVPLIVQRFVGEAEQGGAYGTIRLYTLMVALLAQALFGMLSDRSTLRWGRRRPFILLGTLGNILAIVAVGASPSYWFLFGALVFSQIASNAAHGAEQGLIPDLVPEQYRGRFSGVKAMMDLLPVIIVALTVGPLVAKGQMWTGIFVAVGVLFVAMAITMLVREEPLREPPGPLNWEPFLRLLAMTLVFLFIILGLGQAVKWIGEQITGIRSVPVLMLIMGILGAAAVAAAVVVGVWASVRISIGDENARRYPSLLMVGGEPPGVLGGHDKPLRIRRLLPAVALGLYR